MAAEEEGLDSMTGNDRIWLHSRARLCLIEAIHCLSEANAPDLSMSAGQQRSYRHWHIDPLQQEVENIEREIKYIAFTITNPGDGVRRWVREPEPKEEEKE